MLARFIEGPSNKREFPLGNWAPTQEFERPKVLFFCHDIGNKSGYLYSGIKDGIATYTWQENPLIIQAGIKAFQGPR